MTRHAIIQAARAHEPCTVDGAAPGCPCDCAPGVHLCRIAACAHHGHITMRDFAELISDADAFAGWSLVLDEVTA